jgi:5-methylcytosine-specific restriction endonuclease McrA
MNYNDKLWTNRIARIQETGRARYNRSLDAWPKKIDSLITSWNLWVYKIKGQRPSYTTARKNTCWEDCYKYAIYRWNQKKRMQGWTLRIETIRRNGIEVYKRIKGGMRDMEETLKNERIGTRDIREMLEGQGRRCALTGRELTPENCSLDHVLPLTKGGEHSPSNAQLVTMEVNKAKGMMTEEEFIQLCKDVVAWSGARVK